MKSSATVVPLMNTDTTDITMTTESENKPNKSGHGVEDSWRITSYCIDHMPD